MSRGRAERSSRPRGRAERSDVLGGRDDVTGGGVDLANRETERADVKGGQDDVPVGVGRDGNRSGGRVPRLRGRGFGVGRGRVLNQGVRRGGAEHFHG